MEYTIFPQYITLIVHSTFVLPLVWCATMFTVQLWHWVYAWLDDADEARTNIMMEWTMIHIFRFKQEGYDSYGTKPDFLYSKLDKSLRYTHNSNGALAMIGIPFLLFLFPVTLACLLEFYVIIGLVVAAVGAMFGLRQLIRLTKIVKRHISNMVIHNKENI